MLRHWTGTFLVIVGIAALFPPAVRAARVEVFILGGQSDAVGYGSVAADLPPDLHAPQADVRFWFAEGPFLALFIPSFWITSGNVFVPLQFQSDPAHGTFGGSVDGFGSELTLGRSLADSLPAEVAIVKVAVNGASLAEHWNPDIADSLYHRMMDELARALAALAAAGDTGEVAGFFWVQGATDAGDGASAAAYEANLTSFIQRLRNDLATPTLPFIFYRLHIDTAFPFLDVVRAAQMNVANTVPFTAIVDSDDLPPLGDHNHLSGAAQLMLGGRFADAYLALVRCGDSVVDPGEACDDGNVVAGDGCAPGCTLERVAIAGKKLVVKDRLGDLARRRLVVISRGPGLIDPGPGDPTVSGATLTVANPGHGTTATIELPASRWRVVGADGLAYSDRDREDGPCESALVRSDRLKIVCLGAQVPISLADSPQGRLDVTLQLGAVSPVTRYCLRFGGTVTRDTQATSTRTGVFRARNATATVECGSGR